MSDAKVSPCYICMEDIIVVLTSGIVAGKILPWCGKVLYLYGRYYRGVNKWYSCMEDFTVVWKSAIVV